MPDPAPLRRLTLLVGRNGVGKSSFARLLPLLRQSLGTRTREPLLWWADDGVDFGTFSEALRHGAREIQLTFRLSVSDGQPRMAGSYQLRASLRARPEGSCLSRMSLEAPDCTTLELLFSDDGRVQSLVARLGESEEPVRVDNPGRISSEWLGDAARAEPWSLFGVSWEWQPMQALQHLTRDLFHGNTVEYRRAEVLEKMPWTSDDAVLTYLGNQTFGQAYRKNFRSMSSRSDWARKLRRARFCLEKVVRAATLSEALDDVAARTAWLGPFRAIPERSYRPQNVAVEQLDPRGANLPMFLAALTPEELRLLNEFLKKELSFGVDVKQDGANLAMRITLDGKTYNVVDVGFGYSQLLPVIVQIWASSRRLRHLRDARPLAAMAIEQPELHLHPHHQTRIARVLAASAMQAEGPTLLVETHSDHIVGEVGRLVASGELAPAHVIVLCAEPDPNGGARLREATYDEEGILQNWPAGFMDP